MHFFKAYRMYHDIEMYIVSMPYAEAILLDGSERYLSSMVILNLLLATMVLVVAMDRASFEEDVSKRGIRSFSNVITKNVYQLSSLVLMLFASILMFSEINGIKYLNGIEHLRPCWKKRTIRIIKRGYLKSPKMVYKK